MVFDKPKGSEGPEVYIGDDVTGRYEIVAEHKKHCDDITPEGVFPPMGDNYIPVMAIDRHGELFDGVRFIAMYSDIQLQLAELEAEEGDRVHIMMAGKDENGHWQAEVSLL